MGAVRWLDEDEMRAWHSFLAAGALIDRLVDAQLKEAVGLSHPQYEILVRLSEAPGRAMRMSQLAEVSTSSKSRLSHAVARLEERGWIRRTECPTAGLMKRRMR